MPQSTSPARQTAGLLALTAALVFLIVVAPFWVVRHAQQESLAAAAIVNHTHEIEATVQALLYDLRNRESATVAYAYGHDSPAVRERLAESRRDIPINLARLVALTRDNPDQQLRIGKLGSIIEQRGQLSDTILTKPAGLDDPRDIEWLLDRNPLRFLGAEITRTEQTLLKVRVAESRRLERRTATVTWLAMGLQLVMLGSSALFLARQWRTRRAAEAAAARSNARAQSVLQTVREPMAVVDRELRVVLHNPAFKEVFAAADADAGVGAPISSFGHGTWDAPETRQRLADVLARDRELWDFEITHRGEDGRERTLLVNARRMALPDRSDEVALVTANDVTAQKGAELQVRELNRQLQGKVDQVSEVNRELEAFSYSVSHDLRAPLRHIGGFADKLGRHLGDRNDEKSFHYLNTITTSARRMSQLIDDLLVYSRLGRSALPGVRAVSSSPRSRCCGPWRSCWSCSTTTGQGWSPADTSASMLSSSSRAI